MIILFESFEPLVDTSFFVVVYPIGHIFLESGTQWIQQAQKLVNYLLYKDLRLYKLSIFVDIVDSSFL